jgi:hypothetical protein
MSEADVDELLSSNPSKDKVIKCSNRLLASILAFQVLTFFGLIFMGVIFYKIYLGVDTVKDNLVNKGDSITSNIGNIAGDIGNISNAVKTVIIFPRLLGKIVRYTIATVVFNNFK